jgi:hypothetical protein
MRRGVKLLGLIFLSAIAGCAGASGILDVASGPRAQPCNVMIPDAGAVRDPFQDDRAATMEIGNDGGWCGWYDDLQDGTHWFRSIVAEAPAHGQLRVRRDFERVHVEYSANPGYLGPDAFAVRLGPGFSLRSAKVAVVTASRDSGAAGNEVGITTRGEARNPGGGMN